MIRGVCVVVVWFPQVGPHGMCGWNAAGEVLRRSAG